MKGLSREAQSLLDSARRADSAPAALRARARKNFTRALAAGTLGASTTLAKAAVLSSSTASAGGSLIGGSSLAVAVVSAVITGASIGGMLLSPASSNVTAVGPRATAHPRAAGSTLGVVTARNHPAPATPGAPTAADVTSAAAAVTSAAAPEPMAAPKPSGDKVREQDARPAGSDAAPLPEADTTRDSTAVFDTIANSKASIAHETELLGQVQRALQQNHAASALVLLNRYAAQFPRGALQEEAVASRIVALCQFGRTADAERWRSEFFRRYVNSPFSERVRNACRAQATSAPAGKK